MVLDLPVLINNSFLQEFVEEYRELLQELVKEGRAFLKPGMKLNVRFKNHNGAADDEIDFDLIFLSYLTLLKFDFPNIQINLILPANESGTQLSKYFYRLLNHRTHLEINARQEIFKLYIGDETYKGINTERSGNYIPPLLITSQTIKTLFQPKRSGRDYTTLLRETFQQFKGVLPKLGDRENFYKEFFDKYDLSRGEYFTWKPLDLSGSYFMRALYDLYLLRYLFARDKGLETDYQIGNPIRTKKGDDSPALFKTGVLRTLLKEGVFQFNDVEAYFFSILIQHTDLFKIPNKLPDILEKIRPFIAPEITEKDEKLVKENYITLFNENLVRLIRYTRDIAYALEELSKNIVEHTETGIGVITARIYSFERVVNLKSTEEGWRKQFSAGHKFLDINVIDNGRTGIKEKYLKNLEKEKNEYEQLIENAEMRHTIAENYTDDIQQMQLFSLNQFFNYHTIQLYHQINRVKARLGLLIFSQHILHDRNAQIHISSNSLTEKRPIGFYLFTTEGQIVERISRDYLSLGTNYQFLIPVKEEFEHHAVPQHTRASGTSIGASVFMELHGYGFSPESPHRLIKPHFVPGQGKNKYKKLENLVAQVDKISDGQILVLNAGELAATVSSSSDWIRLLAGLQFGYLAIRDIIVYGLSPEVYEDIVNILKIFSDFKKSDIGFWKQDRQVLFFIPVVHNECRFWFNSILTASDYGMFLKVNQEIDIYHFNLIRLTEPENMTVVDDTVTDFSSSSLFSKSNKLLNFELLIKNDTGSSLYEETIWSMLQQPIKKGIAELDLSKPSA
ncbi:hypothetical protein BEL04_08625 [Mucilaginibacter sp. PPCGB 2223]|uniref:hypothetical protein n=1 Tax=Mucilaginibacter sp. PPCGB 2223 TaxID=1886027 RepID=UPI0008242EBE|nr:hypothetical protein [Mucilaginibacter sp. PPCGB 2223]OCX54313.1 hypothetical protein BEL04_08625 [Mucilaginibacter sp. PPCGB 2223]